MKLLFIIIGVILFLAFCFILFLLWQVGQKVDGTSRTLTLEQERFLADGTRDGIVFSCC